MLPVSIPVDTKRGSNVVVIEADVAEYFPDHDSVNDALRSITKIIKKRKKVTKVKII